MTALRLAISEQTRIMDQIARSCSTVVARAVQPEYLRKVRNTAAALYWLATAEQEMRDFWDSLNIDPGNISVWCEPLSRIGLGSVKDPQSRINQVLNDAKAMGAFADMRELRDLEEFQLQSA
jgi:hypothetical protein